MRPTRHNSRPRSSPIVRWLAFLGLLSVCWAAGLVWFVETLPEAVADKEAHTDAIVVLTGGRGRLEEGLELLEKGLGKRLFVSGVFPGLDVQRLLDIFREGDQDLNGLVNIGTAPDTITNATETAAWMREMGFKEMRLVTSAYHMPRALMEFRAVMPDMAIIAHPVFVDHIKQEEWWEWPGTTNLMVAEYNKALLAWLRLQIQSLAASSAI